MPFKIPKEVEEIGEKLARAGFEAHLVGGCVRDVLLMEVLRSSSGPTAPRYNSVPSDWDIATNAKPEEIQKLFSDSVYENQFGTVGVKTESEDPTLKVIEVTTYRLEGKYTDKRHPDEVRFAKTIEEDLARRDFTVNAIALRISQSNRPESREGQLLIDPYGGEKDLKAKIIHTVGKPDDRFSEDALRLLRAVRFACQLGFSIEEKTGEEVKKHAGLIEFISKERIRDEFSKLLMTENAVEGIEILRSFGLLRHIVPELEEGVGVGQNKHHIYTVYEHNIKSLQYAVQKNFPIELRLASLFHDVGKPKSKRGEGPNSTFYGHQVVGEKMVLKIMDRLRFPKELTEKVALLVREHMFVYDPEVVTLAGVRRLVARVGKKNMDDLLKLREADRIGSGVPKAQPYRLRYLKAMIEKVEKDPIHPKMLKIKGDAVMEILKIEPGPRIGKILAILLEEVLDNPAGNEVEILKKRVAALGKLSDKELDTLAEKAKTKAEQAQERVDDEIKKKYFVD